MATYCHPGMPSPCARVLTEACERVRACDANLLVVTCLGEIGSVSPSTQPNYGYRLLIGALQHEGRTTW